MIFVLLVVKLIAAEAAPTKNTVAHLFYFEE